METYQFFSKTDSVKGRTARGETMAHAFAELARVPGRADGYRIQCAAFDHMNLGRCDFTGAIFEGCRFSGCDFEGAIYYSASFDSACRFYGNFMRAAAGPVMQLPVLDGWTAFAFVADQREVRIRVGCRNFTLPEARAHWSGQPDRRQMLAACDMVELEGRARGWPLDPAADKRSDARNAARRAAYAKAKRAAKAAAHKGKAKPKARRRAKAIR